MIRLVYAFALIATACSIGLAAGALVMLLAPAVPVAPPAQDLQPPRVDRAFMVLNARSLSDRHRAGIHCDGDLGDPAVICLVG